MREPIDIALLNRFLNKKTSKEQNEEILEWVSASEQNMEEFRKIHQIFYLSKLDTIHSDINVDRAWNKLSGQLKKDKNTRKVITLEVFRKIAVSVLILLTVGFGSLWMNDHFFRKSGAGLVQFETSGGEKSKVVLADGTQVWLNSETILKYNVLNPRKVTLSGEAYFEVKKDRSHPFEVFTASGMEVKVTGTHFNLRSYDDESVVETSLEEGQVIIEGSHAEELAVLKPDQQASYNIKNGEVKVKNVNAGIYSIWRNNELQFTDISFAELVPRIERWYGVKIQLDPNIGNDDHFTMTIKTESLRELLTMMQLTSKFNYEINGSLVKIYQK